MKESPVTFTLYNTPLYTPHVRQNSCKPMLGEILNAPQSLRSAAPAVRTLPRHLLYSIFARIGGSGLDTDAFETLRASYRGGFLGKAIAYDNRQTEIPASLIHSLRWHPVRLISFFDRPYYYGAKKKYLDWIASRHLATGRYDLFHSWSGDCLRSLQVAKQRRIPSIVEIPTWHRDGGKKKVDWPKNTESASKTPGVPSWKARLLLQRKRFIEEYQLADLLLVLSERAANTFRVRGFPEEKLFYLPRGVDVERFKPGNRPAKFRAVFSGALIKRKGIQHVLEAWHRLNLPDVVRDGVEGIIVKPGDVDAIAAALQHLHRHPEIVQQMGSATRRRVVENFTWDHFRTRLLDAYETAMR